MTKKTSTTKTSKKNTNKRLGRGLGELLRVNTSETEKKPEKIELKSPKNNSLPETSIIHEVMVEELSANSEQPRQHFNEEALESLTRSIKEQGIMQPIIATRSAKGGYEIIAGERRWRAAQRAGLKKVPIILKEVSSQNKLELAIIENIQRDDLNPLEEAEAYKLLAEKYNLKQKEIAERVGKDRATVANIMRITLACRYVKEMVSSNQLSLGHAKVLISVEDKKLQTKLAEKAVRLNLSVRATESMVKSTIDPQPKNEGLDYSSLEKEYKDVEAQLTKKLGTKVKIVENGGKGKIQINFHNLNQFNQIIESVID